MREVRDELLSNAPSLVGHQIEIANACVWVSKAARMSGQLHFAIESLQRNININARIVGEFPGDAEHSLRLSSGETDLGVAFMSQSTHDGDVNAEKWFNSARARITALQEAGNLHRLKNTASGLLSIIDRNLGIINATRKPEAGASL